MYMQSPYNVASPIIYYMHADEEKNCAYQILLSDEAIKRLKGMNKLICNLCSTSLHTK